MCSSHLTRRINVWLACLAILMGSLAPTISRTLNSLPGSAFLEVCTAVGAELGWTDAGKGSRPANGTPSDPMQHCPLCVLQASAPGLPPAPLLGLTLLRLAFQVPELFLAAPRTLYAWTSAQARAPPHRS